MKRKFIVIFTVSIIGCSSNQNKKALNTGQDKFTYDFHLANQNGKDVIDKGETNCDNFIEEFKNFPWLDQLSKANELGKTSPTITAQDHLNSTDLWTSIEGDSSQYDYIVGYNFPKTIAGGLFKKERVTKWVTMYVTEDTEKILKCYDLFFKRDTLALTSELKQFRFYGEVEARK
jgi:hypothetical protein